MYATNVGLRLQVMGQGWMRCLRKRPASVGGQLRDTACTHTRPEMHVHTQTLLPHRVFRGHYIFYITI